MIEYVGFWKRALSLLLDVIIIKIFLMVYYTFVSPVLDEQFWSSLTNHDDSTYKIYKIIYALILPVLIWIFYETILTSSKLQGTFGKVILSIAIVDRNHERLSYQKAFVRAIVKVISCAFVFPIQVITAFTSQKRAVQDMIAKTYVVTTKSLALSKIPKTNL